MFDYLTHILDNGMRVAFVPTGAPSVALSLFIGAGSKYETRENNGVSHFLEHTVFKGTTKRPDYLTISRSLDSIGGVFDGGTSREVTSYFIKSTSNHLEFMFDMISDLVFNPLLKEEDIEKERGVIIEEFNMYEDDYPAKVSDVFRKMVFGDNPLGWKISGERKTVAKMAREDIFDYKNKFYCPANMVLVLAGGLEKGKKSEIFSLAQKWFGRKDQRRVKQIKIKTKPSFKKTLNEDKKIEQTHFVFGLPTFGLSDPRRWQSKILSAIVGGNKSSRLFRLIREQRGWAYYIYSFNELYQEAGYFAVQAGVKNGKLAETVALIKNELVNLSSSLTEVEIKRAKDYFLGRLLISFESPEDVAELVGESWIREGKILTAEEILQKIKKVTLDEVRAFCRDFFKPQNFYLAAIGPKGNKTL